MKVPWRKRLLRGIRGRLRARNLGRHGIAVLADSRNGVLAVDPADFSVARTLLTHGEYGIAEIDALAHLLADGGAPCLVFVGAHIGSILVPLVRATRAPRIMAFEPSPHNLRLLELNLALNGIAGVDLQRVAVGERTGSVRFTQNRINTGNSRIDRNHGRTEVPVTTLDSSPLEHWERIDLMIMDVEGCEAQAMRGGTRTLARTRYLFVEYAPEQLVEQGSSGEEFVALAAAQFESMYLLGAPARFFRREEYVAYLLGLVPRRGLLLNLLLCRNPERDPRL